MPITISSSYQSQNIISGDAYSLFILRAFILDLAVLYSSLSSLPFNLPHFSHPQLNQFLILLFELFFLFHSYLPFPLFSTVFSLFSNIFPLFSHTHIESQMNMTYHKDPFSGSRTALSSFIANFCTSLLPTAVLKIQ